MKNEKCKGCRWEQKEFATTCTQCENNPEHIPILNHWIDAEKFKQYDSSVQFDDTYRTFGKYEEGEDG